LDSRPSDFFIGGLISTINQALDARLKTYFPFEEFPELRPIHAPVFQYLPPQGARLSELAEQLNMTRQAAKYLVDYLDENGYLERVPDPTDNRAQIIQRTERGWAFHKKISPLSAQIQAEWTATLGEERMRQLVDLLRQLTHEVLGIEYGGTVAQATHRPPTADDVETAN
jgi:DNA-binding MarR family transcriptional regulator